jgi:hypothetical protein
MQQRVKSDVTPTDSHQPRPHDGAAHDQGPDHRLMQLLHTFKDARRRRDAAGYGSAAWREANAEIQWLQHEIFGGPIPSTPVRADVGRVPLGPDDELAPPENRAIF